MDRSIGLNPRDIRYLNVDSKARGFGPNRLKSLEMEGRWVLSPHSIPFIRAAFEQVEKLNGPGRMEELMGPSMNAIGLSSWTSDNRMNDQDSYVEPGHEYIRRAVVVKKPQYPRSQSVQIRRNPLSPSIDRRSSPSPLPLPPLPPIQTTSPVPSELPHRTAGPAHQYKRPSPNDYSNYLPPLMWSRSRSSSVSPRLVAVNQTAVKSPNQIADDPGYYSNYSSVQSSPRRNDVHYRPPHRTPVLSDSRPCIASYDNDYDDGILRRANSMASLGRYNPNYRSGRRIRFDIPGETSKWTSRYSSTDSLNHSPGSTWSLRRYGSRDNVDLPSSWQFNRQGSRRYLGGRSPIQNFR
ncbi:hypothetical protein M3Y96_00578500 [Aphelenchoides besseyi]|nr:hypothetical protein M3Y96_00578500 [Aphelenchoides besseyi]